MTELTSGPERALVCGLAGKQSLELTGRELRA
jgi:hypothetical protein